MIRSYRTIPVPRGFNFWRTVYSHGWCDLLPFSFDKEHQTLSRLVELHDGAVMNCTLRDNSSGIGIEIQSLQSLTTIQDNELQDQLKQCLRVDEDLTEFYREAKRHPKYRWIPKAWAGRLLRSPSEFEDIVKMICTTNCTWALTKIIVQNLCQELGKSLDGSGYSFPTPEALAGAREAFLRKNIRSGYRSPYLIEFAYHVASGKLDTESWRTSSDPTKVLYEQVLAVKGVGAYAAGNILRLLGRYDYLALDSWVRAWFYSRYHKGRKVSDKTIQKRYVPLGKWRGLFLWLEATRDWFDKNGNAV